MVKSRALAGNLGCAPHKRPQARKKTASIRLDSELKMRLAALSRLSKRSTSLLATEAITAYVEQEEWQLGEIREAIDELDGGKGVSHEEVARWLKSWGTKNETTPPR